jgi:hypothetical protein
MKPLLWCVLLGLTVATSARSQELFHGWSKDGTWLSFQRSGRNDVTELYFCQTSEVAPKWPAVLNEQDKMTEAGLECVRFLDVNKAPYQWQKQLSTGEASTSRDGLSIMAELVTDGESPGFVVQGQGKTQNCYASGVRESSKLQKAWWHPTLKYVAVLIDGSFHHCTVTIRSTKPAAPTPTPKKKS